MNTNMNVGLKNGKLDGLWVDYWSNEKLFFRRTYVDGFCLGPAKKWYPNGLLNLEEYYSNGFKEGEEISYFYNTQ